MSGHDDFPIDSEEAKELIHLFETGQIKMSATAAQIFKIKEKYQRFGLENFRRVFKRIKEARKRKLKSMEKAIQCGITYDEFGKKSGTFAAAAKAKAKANPKSRSTWTRSDDEDSEASDEEFGLSEERTKAVLFNGTKGDGSRKPVTPSTKLGYLASVGGNNSSTSFSGKNSDIGMSNANTGTYGNDFVNNVETHSLNTVIPPYLMFNYKDNDLQKYIVVEVNLPTGLIPIMETNLEGKIFVKVTEDGTGLKIMFEWPQHMVNESLLINALRDNRKSLLHDKQNRALFLQAFTEKIASMKRELNLSRQQALGSTIIIPLPVEVEQQIQELVLPKCMHTNGMGIAAILKEKVQEENEVNFPMSFNLVSGN